MRSAAKLLGLLAPLLLVWGCQEGENGPVQVSAIGGPPRLVDPSREALDAPSAFLLEATAQGLVRFDAAGEIEPALAQRWIVSDDGLRYTFRLARLQWANGSRVTAGQVAARLRAAAAPSSRNALKPLLGAIDEIVGMTDEVLEISLKSPRPNFLQLLAQPEMAVLRNGEGLGPYRAVPAAAGAVSLTLPPLDEDAVGRDEVQAPPLLLRGEGAGLAVARFAEGETDLVLGGALGDLPLARAARTPAATLVFDPAPGLLGLAFTGADGRFAAPEARRALAMAIDRAALVQALGVGVLQPREALLPAGVAESPQPALPAWATAPLPERRSAAAALLAALPEGAPESVRVAIPEGRGYDLLFAHLRRDWATIRIRAERAPPNAPADLRLIDQVAPAGLATWYLRHFTCEASRICDPAADEMLAAARIAPAPAARRALIATADRILTDLTPFIALTNPVRWSLVSPRLTGFRPNAFGRHPAGELIRPTP